MAAAEHGHGAGHSHGHGLGGGGLRSLVIALALNAVYTIVEAIVGLSIGSLALLG